MTERRTCLGCNREFSVTAAGVLRKHDKSTWLGGANYETKPCEGATQAVLSTPHCVTLAGGSDYRFVALRKAYAKIGLKWPPKVKA